MTQELPMTGPRDERTQRNQPNSRVLRPASSLWGRRVSVDHR